MARFNLNSKIKGIFSVSSSNLLAFALSMLTSFILPIYISVSEYGYWQLFWLYASYVGFMALGFNDGIHLNYAKSEYEPGFFKLFGVFRSFIFKLSFFETILLLVGTIIIKQLLPDALTNSLWFYLLIVLNIIPTLVLGFFTYSNQCTLRFHQYSVGNIVDKIFFGVAMLLLICFGCKNVMAYIAAYTASRYVAIGYHFYSSRELFGKTEERIIDKKREIRENFVNGFPLMISYILGGATIIVGGRLLVENKYGIEAFSAYSFSLHTLVIASQFISAVATVFYPIMKRTPTGELHQLYKSFDKVSALASMPLLLTYYVIIVLINIVYPKYSSILEYLFLIYPLFVYQCKSNLLIINMYKVENRPIELIFVNAAGVAINLICVYVSYLLFDSVYAIAFATTLGFMTWYYICTFIIYRRENWKLTKVAFFDIAYVFAFFAINIICNKYIGNLNIAALVSFIIWTVALSLFTLFEWKTIRRIFSEFNFLMKD